MSLPALLSELAALLPERVRVESSPERTTVYVNVGYWRYLCYLGPHPPLIDWEARMLLEAALREECEARGWTWTAGRDAGNRAYASVMPTPAHRPPHYASTPAEALAAATLAALKSEKGEG